MSGATGLAGGSFGGEWATWIVWALGYLLGSVPFGLILTRIGGAGDLRAIGSGNIGATNVLRTGRKGLAAATLLLDGGKGWLAVFAAGLLWPTALLWGIPLAALAGIGALVGHCFPLWLGFRGGKGVATMLGICFGAGWQVGLVVALLWLLVARITKISSLGGIAAAMLSPVVAVVLGKGAFAAALGVIATIVVLQHRANIERLAAGTEPRIGQGK